MKLRQLIYKINYRQVILHCLATWFVIHGFMLIPYVLYPDIVLAASTNDPYANSDLFKFTILSAYAPLTGLLAACLISYSISIKKRWFGINSLIVSLVMFSLYRFDLLGWNNAKTIFLFPARFFDDFGIKLLVTIAILLLIAGLLFFMPFVIHFIDKAATEDKLRLIKLNS